MSEHARTLPSPPFSAAASGAGQPRIFPNENIRNFLAMLILASPKLTLQADGRYYIPNLSLNKFDINHEIRALLNQMGVQTTEYVDGDNNGYLSIEATPLFETYRALMASLLLSDIPRALRPDVMDHLDVKMRVLQAYKMNLTVIDFDVSDGGGFKQDKKGLAVRDIAKILDLISSRDPRYHLFADQMGPTTYILPRPIANIFSNINVMAVTACKIFTQNWRATDGRNLACTVTDKDCEAMKQSLRCLGINFEDYSSSGSTTIQISNMYTPLVSGLLNMIKDNSPFPYPFRDRTPPAKDVTAEPA